jgi:nonribosomal peptide synthetase protein BlmVII
MSGPGPARLAARRESVAGLLAELGQLRVSLAADGDQLRCTAPPGVLTPELLARLRAAKEPLLRALRDGASLPRPATGGPADEAAGPRAQPGAVLSFAQERMWLQSVLRPGDNAFNLPLRIELSGPLQPAALRLALSQVCARHELLRTRYLTVRGRPVPVVDPASAVDLPLADLSTLPPPARDDALRELAATAAHHPFDLASGPVLRAVLIRIAAGRHSLLLTRHHIASDGWSLGVLLTELAELYRAQLAGRPPGLAPLPAQYRDFAAWQRDQAGAQSQQERLERWARRLQGARFGLELLAEPGPGARREPARCLRATLPAAYLARLRGLAREHRTTLFTVLLTAFGCALSRLGGQADIVVGSPAAGRARVQFEPLIGFFVAMLPLRLDMSGRPATAELIRRNHDVVQQALADQEVPVERIIARLRPDRPVSDNPLFAVSFVLQNTPASQIELPGIAMSVASSPAVMPKYAIELTASERDGELDLVLEYDGRRLAAESAARLQELILAVLDAALAPPDVPLAAVPARPAAGAAQRGRQGPALPAEAAACVHTLVARTAARHPDAIAVSQAGSQLSYRALSARARQLTAALRARGVGPETLVGLCGEPSPGLVAGALGILGAGAGYLPLDPADPAAARARICARAGLRIAVTRPGLLGEDIEQLDIDEPGQWAAAGPGAAPGPPAAPANVASTIYPPRDTGPGEGVVLTHANLSGVLAGLRRALPVLDSPQVWSLTRWPASALSALEMWGALTSGGRLAIPAASLAPVPGELAGYVRTERVTVLGQAPDAFGQHAPALLRAGAAATLRVVLMAGEPRAGAQLRPWFTAAADGPVLAALCGQPETAGCSAARTLTAASGQAPPVPLGPPVPGQTVTVLGDRGEHLPPGARGGLAAGGAGLARGYLGRPGLTADRFVPDPGAGHGARLFRSAVLARVLRGGEVAYLGRAGGQLLLRGHQVEPSQIEAALLTCPGVLAAAVVAGTAAGHPHLAGYVVADQQVRQGGERRLKDRLAERLPRYLVPARLAFLDALPLRRDGTLDTAALAGCGGQDTGRTAAPRTQTESTLAAIVAELLGISAAAIQPQDNLFDLGADSLAVTQLHARIIETFHVNPPVRRTYQALDIASLAATVDELQTQRRQDAVRAALAEVGGTEEAR